MTCNIHPTNKNDFMPNDHVNLITISIKENAIAHREFKLSSLALKGQIEY